MGLQNCKINTFGEIKLAVASATAGRDSAVVTSYSTMAAGVAAGKLTVLVDTSNSAERERYFGGNEIEGVDWGLKRTVEAKSGAIAAFLAGVDKAKMWAASHSDEEVAQVLHKYKGFNTRTIEDLAADYGKTKNYLDVGSQNGYISQETWKTTLTALESWKIPNFDGSGPSDAYDEIIDMKPFDASKISR